MSLIQDDKDKPRDADSDPRLTPPQTKRVVLIGGGSMLALAAMVEKITTLPLIDVLDAAGDADKEDELRHRMCENIRRESGR